MLSARFKVLDLFCGAGGLSTGFELTERFQTVAGIDNNLLALNTFYNNHRYATSEFKEPADLSSLTGAEILSRLPSPEIDVIVGGPPCQGFSVAGKRDSDDGRNGLVWDYCRIVIDIKPKAFVMENVPGLLLATMPDGSSVVEALRRRFRENGYTTSIWKLNAADYGVPQRRIRTFLAGFLKSKGELAPPPRVCFKASLFSPESCEISVGEAFADLPEPNDTDPQEYVQTPLTDFQRFLRKDSCGIYNHTPSKHKPEMIDRMRAQMPGTRLYKTCNHSWYKLMPDKPSMTVKENHRAPFVHPLHPRVTTPRECARLQSFPDRYVFLGTKTAQLIQIGNAVPPLLGKAIANLVADVLRKERRLLDSEALLVASV